MRPDLPPTPTPINQAASSGGEPISRRLSAWLAAGLVVALLAVSVCAFGWISAKSDLRDQQTQTRRAITETEGVRVDYQSRLDTATAKATQLETQQASMVSEIGQLKSQVRRLKNLASSLGGSAQAYLTEYDCVNAILAAYNSITYQNQWYAAFTNVAKGPQCVNVLTISSK